MNVNFGQILELESVNSNHIHLFLNDAGTEWVAYGKSALNLQNLAPGLVNEEIYETFWKECFQLFRVTIDCEVSEACGLFTLCTLLGDDHVELTIPQSKERQN